MCDHAIVLARAPLTGLRLLGMAGSGVLAAGAYQVAARPGQADADGLPGLDQAAGTIACLVGLVILTTAWWLTGRVTAAPGGPPLTGGWMLVTAALWTVPLLLVPPIASRDVYAYACQGAVLELGSNPHTVGSADLPCPWLDSVPPIWRDGASPYGPVFSLISAGAVAVSGGHLAVAVGALRVVALIGVVLGTWYGRRLARACGVSEARAAWIGLASPLVAVHAIAGAHNDALVTGLVIAALAAAIGPVRGPGPQPRRVRGPGPQPRRVRGPAPLWRRGLYAGAALGLATGVKATALIAVPFVALALVATRAPRSNPVPPRLFARAGLTVAAATVVAFAVPAIASGLGLGFVRGLTRTGELAQWTSPPTAVGMTVGYLLRAVGVGGGFDAAVAVARGAGLLALVGVVLVLVWRAARTSDQPVREAVAGAGLAFAALAVLGPVFYPWYALAPLALLAVSIVDERVRAWLGVVSGALSFLILPNGVGLAPRTKLPGALLVTAAVAGAAHQWGRWRRRRVDPPGPRATPTSRASTGPVRSRNPGPRSGR